ncbi:MAG: NAD(P)-dependent glycerol-3-phosphate dehydrogenase [Candidatus Omnitrophica bacterium]|nr:NAD(P)-dependent glycerol-3-phosphate dehydrogenase [Candidatus Omnitrophota bacterium]MCM8830666.1 NAD(P)-dependent glycerol-3-phosphate dehydrogenase [Candidatus Omnitrophota bacterium]
MREKISILGAGSWGTTLAVILSKKENLEVTLWSPFAEKIEEIKKFKENRTFLPLIAIPQQLILTSDLDKALISDIIMIAIPVEYLRQNLKKIRQIKINLKNKIFLSLIKGIEIKSLKRPTSIIKEELKIKDTQIAVLSGPTIAREVAAGIPAVATIASKNLAVALKLQRLFKDTPLRIYTNVDVVGIETAGALKNIIAIACGISDGLGFGTNTKAALICRGLKEMIRFAKAFGIKKDVFFGISGIGDLCTTCFSKFSRNRTVGEEIGRGIPLKQVLKNMEMVAEGVNTTKAVYNLAKKYKIDMPITTEVYKILYLNKSPKEAVYDLMSRPLKAE